MENLNLNATECIVKATGLTGTTVTNICSNTKHFVPHGAADLLMGYSLGALCFIMIAGLLFLGVAMVRDLR